MVVGAACADAVHHTTDAWRGGGLHGSREGCGKLAAAGSAPKRSNAVDRINSTRGSSCASRCWAPSTWNARWRAPMNFSMPMQELSTEYCWAMYEPARLALRDAVSSISR